MRVAAACAVCANKWAPGTRPKLRIVVGELQDTGLANVKCPEGHTSVVLYDSRRYEVLMRSGAMALLDGYCNEAIASFATALERAYEFYVRVAYRSRGIDSVSFEEVWKDVEMQSERQFGAFQFTYLLEHNRHLKLHPDIPKIRNRTVHRGRIATETEALAFAEPVYQRIREIEDALKPHTDAVKEEKKHEIEQQKLSIPKGMEWIILEAFSFKLDSDGAFAGFPSTFSEYIHAVQRGKLSGWL